MGSLLSDFHSSNHIDWVVVGSENITDNDNCEQSDNVTLELAKLIDQHNHARRILARLRAIHNHYEASPVNCDLVEKSINQAIQAERVARDQLLLCQVSTVQQAATKAVHLRNVLLQDEAETEARLDDWAGSVKRPKP